MSRTTGKSQIEDARKRLLELVKPGDTIYCILRNVSASGMTRVIQLVKIEKDEKGQPYTLHLGRLAARATDYGYDEKREGVRVSGCGMDMGFHLVYTLGRVLFPDGGDLQHSTRTQREETRETDGGYLLRSQWL